MDTPSRREILHSVGLGGVALLAGCNSLSDEAPPSANPATDVVSNPDYVRPCTERITGPFEPGDSDVAVGPLTFANVLKHMPAKDITPGGESVKARVVIDPGTVVTLVVPEAERGHVALDYNWNDWYSDGTPLENAQRAVRFEACGSDEPRQYNGGIVVTDPRCVTLHVWVRGENAPRNAVLPVGGRCE